MRIVIVNHCHPEYPHVCGLRAWRFAEALTGLGHAVVVVCAAWDGPPSANLREISPQRLGAELGRHDWSEPLVVPVRPRPAPLLARAREGRLPPAVRRPILFHGFLFRGGVFHDWTDAAGPAVEALSDGFRPDAVWAIFGNSSVFELGRALARRSAAPWVGDLKDGWDFYVPRPLRAVLARRFADAAGLTALSRVYAEQAAPWFGRMPRVLRSGIEWRDIEVPPPPPGATRRILLSGSLYDRGSLRAFLRGIAAWAADDLSAAQRATYALAYVGGDAAVFAEEASALAGDLPVLEARGQIPHPLFMDMVRAAWVNVFVKKARAFHHKAVELLSAGRPVLCLPEGEEEAEIAASVGLEGLFHSCADATAARVALEAVRRAGDDAGGDAAARRRMAPYTWDGLAATLAAILAEARR